MNEPIDAGAGLHDLISYLDSSRSPWHATSSAAQRLIAAGFQPMELADDWNLLPAAGFGSG